jgi:hypothetical protein
MKKYNKYLRGLALAAVAALAPLPHALALSYNNSNLDAMLCFREASESHNLDLEVDIGPITNYLALPIGTSTNITQYTPSQLVDAVGVSNFAGVKFSVTACNRGTLPTNYPVAGDTLWATRARLNPAAQSALYGRSGDNSLTTAGAKVFAIGSQASSYSGTQPAGPDNTATAVGIPPGTPVSSCEIYLGSGNLAGTYTPAIEATAPASFTSPVVADLYENVPTGSPDPVNGNATPGQVAYIGYFTFKTDGTMTFTRSTAQPVLTITQTGGVNTVSFLGFPNVNYTLHETNSAGLTVPRSTWPALGTTGGGGGGTTNLTDSSGDPNRFYFVGAH